jgi:signal transduction histidine kinase
VVSAASPHGREEERLRILDECEILDTAPEDVFDRIAYIAAQICDCPIALVNFIDRKRQWFKAALGTELRGSPREFAFCAHTILGNELVVVDDATGDPRLADNPLVIDDPKVRFYAGVPLFVGPLPIGTLCVIDVTPRALSVRQREALVALAREAADQLILRRALKRSQRLDDNRRELASMIVHDMRSPLTVALSGAQFLAADEQLPIRDRQIVDQIILAAKRLNRMVRDLLDIGRSESGRLLPIADGTPLQMLADQVASSLRAVAIEHRLRFVSNFTERDEARIDADLIRRIVGNLAENAFKYAPRETEVTVEMSLRPGPLLRIDVGDQGPGIPLEERERIFDASYRIERDHQVDPRGSYGLGLRFCRAAADAMGGKIWVEDNAPVGTRFVAELPLHEVSSS